MKFPSQFRSFLSKHSGGTAPTRKNTDRNSTYGASGIPGRRAISSPQPDAARPPTKWTTRALPIPTPIPGSPPTILPSTRSSSRCSPSKPARPLLASRPLLPSKPMPKTVIAPACIDRPPCSLAMFALQPHPRSRDTRNRFRSRRSNVIAPATGRRSFATDVVTAKRLAFSNGYSLFGRYMRSGL